MKFTQHLLLCLLLLGNIYVYNPEVVEVQTYKQHYPQPTGCFFASLHFFPSMGWGFFGLISW